LNSKSLLKDDLFYGLSGFKKEGKVGDRFRLVYLKSTGLEKSNLDESFSSPDAEKFSSKTSLSSEYNISKAFSSQEILRQAKIDLKHPDPKVRIFATQYYLEKSYPSIAMPILHEILSDQDPGVRAQALSSLIKFKDPILYPFLKKHLKDRDPKVRIAALRGMFRFQEKIDLNILLQFLSDESSRVRRKLATLLGWTQIEGAFPILMELLRDQDSKVRKAALFSLVTLYPEQGEDRLVEAMTDRDPDIRKWARDILNKMLAKPLEGRKSF
jgi:HEAT repeat protein